MAIQIAYNMTTGPAEARARELMLPGQADYIGARPTRILMWSMANHSLRRGLNDNKKLGRLAPPRVWSAVFRTMLNGWVTARRMPGRFTGVRSCIFTYYYTYLLHSTILMDSCYRNINFYFLWEKLTYDVKEYGWPHLIKKFQESTFQSGRYIEL